MSDLLIPALKAAASVLVAGASVVFVTAQEAFPLDGVGTVGLIGVLAVLVARYTFRQLEDYRGDLKAARARIDELEAALSKLGQAKAKVERRNRELEAYAHRIELWAGAAGAGSALPELPDPPPTRS